MSKMTDAALMPSIRHLEEVLSRSALRHEDFSHIVMHQTSRSVLREAARVVSREMPWVPQGRSHIDNLADRGNTASTSHFVALMDQSLGGRIRSGQSVAFSITGSGLTLGSALYTLDDLPDRLRRRQRRKLRLPVAEHIGLGVGQLAHLADLEEELARDLSFHRGLARDPLLGLFRFRRKAVLEVLRRAEHDGLPRPYGHLFPGLWVSPFSLLLFSDQKRPEAADLHAIPVPQSSLDELEDDVHEDRRLLVGNAAVTLVDNTRQVCLRHGWMESGIPPKGLTEIG
jgi:hypothetical protein